MEEKHRFSGVKFSFIKTCRKSSPQKYCLIHKDTKCMLVLHGKELIIAMSPDSLWNKLPICVYPYSSVAYHKYDLIPNPSEKLKTGNLE
ncbi:hypothetical protein Echvi_2906 [Echinicola vietnamensis DSM 17526]|uniref:Uncharacterized protein n=1 Tax=Echinicola vietnamensis (strain DSM 17526 / LMG 23754 / KMM 6221) TaxID=926556 RepID=L0G2S6_ECHVK|nr:hypothetical protein Echvi_2906 [Echinicola vietnamensis DSM 17526]